MPSSNAAARRNVLAIVASAKRHLKWIGEVWTVRGTVYEPHPDGPSQMGDYRDRREDEYPENQPREWATTAAQLDKVLHELTILRDYAERNAGADYAARIARHRESLKGE